MSMGNVAECESSQTYDVSTPILLLPIYSIATSHQFSTVIMITWANVPLHRHLHLQRQDMQSELQLTIEEVPRTVFLALDTTNATGPDGIASRLLKETAWQIAPSLTQMFNKSLSCGEIPDKWKLANIVPVHKKGEKSQVESYKPISLLSIISKVLERCVLRNIRDHLLQLINDEHIYNSAIRGS